MGYTIMTGQQRKAIFWAIPEVIQNYCEEGKVVVAAIPFFS